MDESNLRTFCSQLSVRLGLYKTNQGWISAPCPMSPWLHVTKIDRNPSFAVHVNNTGVSAYQCFTCKQHGSLNKLALELGHYRKDPTLTDIANEIALAELRGFTPQEWEDTGAVDRKIVAANRTIYPSFHEDAWAVAYVRQRGINMATAFSLGLRGDPERGRVLFPVYDIQGTFRGYSGRAIELPDVPHHVFSQWVTREKNNRVKVRDYLGLPKRELLLGGHRVKRRAKGRIVLVEGLFAYARLRQHGIPNVVALLGSIVTPEKTQLLIDWNLPIVCLTDDDEAGREAIYGHHPSDGSKNTPGIIDLLYGQVPILLPKWPMNKTDPDELDKSEVMQMIAQAELFTKA